MANKDADTDTVDAQVASARSKAAAGSEVRQRRTTFADAHNSVDELALRNIAPELAHVRGNGLKPSDR